MRGWTVVNRWGGIISLGCIRETKSNAIRAMEHRAKLSWGVMNEHMGYRCIKVQVTKQKAEVKP